MQLNSNKLIILVLILPLVQDEDATQLFGDGFCKYIVALLQTVHFVLSFPTVQDALDTTPIKNDYF